MAWTVGSVKITAVLESADALSPEIIRGVVLPDATPKALRQHPWLAPHYVDERWEPRMVVQALVVESEGLVIVVDTCIGNHKPRPNPAFCLDTPFLDRLRAAGYPPEGVHRVLCTHLHFDHVGWNTRLQGGAWVPTFPNARYLVAEREWARFAESASDGTMPAHIADSVLPILHAGLFDTVAGDHAITGQVRLHPTPGHTPGHVSVCISSQGQKAWITGDALHHPCQLAHPDWQVLADTDGEQARATREQFLRDAERSGALVIGTHFAAPAAGRVTRDGDAYRFQPEE